MDTDKSTAQEMREISQMNEIPGLIRPKSKAVDTKSRSDSEGHEAAKGTSIGDEDMAQLMNDHEELKLAYAELRREAKMVTRETREQSVEIRDLKRQNSMLKEAYNNIQRECHSSDRKLTKSEKNKYMEHFEMLEEQAQYYQHEYRKREAHLGYLTRQTRDANNEKDGALEESMRLQRRIRELNASLTECRDDLLRLQPPTQTSDSEISDQYSNLCQQIAGWVDDKTEDPDHLEEYFTDLSGVNDLPEAMRRDVSLRQFRYAKNHPECLTSLTQYLIHCRLQEEVLGHSIFVFGLDDSNINLLQSIEEALSELEPKRDSLTLRRWRSETLQGLLKMEDFVAEQDRRANNLAESLRALLQPMLDLPNSSSVTADILNLMIRPAVKLANTMCTSTTDYQLFQHLFARSSTAPFAVHRNEIQHYNLLDNATSKLIRPDSAIKVADDGKIGEEMFVVSPGIARTGSEENKKSGRIVLVKPSILIKLDEPMGKRIKAGVGKALGGWASAWLSGSAVTQTVTVHDGPTAKQEQELVVSQDHESRDKSEEEIKNDEHS